MFRDFKRSVFLVFFLSLITCGIYGLIWMCTTTNMVARECPNDQRCKSGGLAILFSFLTCGFYGLYWVFVICQKLELIRKENKMPSRDDSVLVLILTILTTPIIGYMVMQSNMNNIADAGENIQREQQVQKIETSEDEEF